MRMPGPSRAPRSIRSSARRGRRHRVSRARIRRGGTRGRLVDVLVDRALAERMGAAGREVALAELTTDRMIDRFEAVYKTRGSRGRI